MHDGLSQVSLSRTPVTPFQVDALTCCFKLDVDIDSTHWHVKDFYSEPEVVYCIRHGDELPCPTCSKKDQ